MVGKYNSFVRKARASACMYFLVTRLEKITAYLPRRAVTWGGLAPHGLPVPTPLGLERDTSQSEVYRVLRCSCQQIN